VQGLGICLEGDRDLAWEICIGILHATHTRLAVGVVSTEDTDEIWKTAKEEAMEKVKGRANRLVGADSPIFFFGSQNKSDTCQVSYKLRSLGFLRVRPGLDAPFTHTQTQ
jgi:hypothetical protein